MKSIDFRPEAKREYVESCEFYGKRDAALRQDFEIRVTKKLDSIARNLELYPVVEDDVREATIDRFPYTLYFRVTDKAIRVIAVFHHRRDPSVWQSRMEES